jgi:hypothetical protein
MGTGKPEQIVQRLDTGKTDRRTSAVGTPKTCLARSKMRREAVHAARNCGTCAVCCGGYVRLVVGDIIVDGAPCPHSTGHACGMYEHRPTTCRDFACAWLKPESALPGGFRPDMVGVIVLDHRLTWRDFPVDVLVVAGTPRKNFLSWYEKYARRNMRLFLLQQGGFCSAFGPQEFQAAVSARLERGERLY